ncbi:MFS transporter [Rhodoferax sediminis]|jgi:MFS family permease|uniref:MFS transporter n=1 Tax=Rhodoferax sediminis TaxID=2509614 RepID=A0A515D8S2_9BURK|nr:MFS transporter [Rhodoferax sediminis]QDL36813.1 MFS transporter [Rhodoferax sediminis]
MNVIPDSPRAGNDDDYLISKRQAWFAFAMTFGLMLFDYIDRQVIVSLFPHIKSEWHLSDKQLGSLVSIISIVVGVGGIPVALLADRISRVKSIVVMSTIWSLATISCMFTANFGQLFAARAVVGAGETGYGSVGAALIATLFPKRLRSTVLGAFFAAASLGAVLGVVLGGVIAAQWGWKAAFGVVGVPGLVLALLYLFVRDYKTVALTPKVSQVSLVSLVSQASHQSLGGTLKHIFGTLARTPTLLWACLAGAMQLVTMSAVTSWLPSFLNRFHSMTPAAAGKQTALVILVSAVGVILWGIVVDRLARRTPRYKLPLLSVLCVVTSVIFMEAFGGSYTGDAQFKLIVFGGFFMTSIMGVITGIAMDVIHPGMRSTGAAVLAVILNLCGLAVGPFLTGVLSDQWGLQQALTVVPLFSILAAALFIIAMRTYDADVARISDVKLDVAPALTGHLSTDAAA